MAREILDYDGVVIPVSGTFEFGDIKDNPNGTTVNRKSNSDLQQFFQKIMQLAGITPNGNPDNKTNEYQLVQALNKLINQESSGMAAAFGAGGFVAVQMSGMAVTGSGTYTISPGWFFYNNQYVRFTGGTWSGIPVGDVVLVLIGSTDGLPSATIQIAAPVTDATHFELSNLMTWAAAVGITGILSSVAANTTSVSTLNTEVALGSWANVTFSAGWTGTLQYRKDGVGRVYIAGIATSTAISPPNLICNIPAGFRPFIQDDQTKRFGSGSTFSTVNVAVTTVGDLILPDAPTGIIIGDVVSVGWMIYTTT